MTRLRVPHEKILDWPWIGQLDSGTLPFCLAHAMMIYQLQEGMNRAK